MYVAPQERPFDSLSFAGLTGSLADLGSDAIDPEDGLLSAMTQGDNVSRLLSPDEGQAIQSSLGMASNGMSFAANPLGSLLGGISSLLSQLSNYLTQGQSAGGEQQYANASASSNGDPHLSFTGTAQNGTSADQHWDSMASHSDLLDSDSFNGGYRVSTQTTAPNANGVTYNQSASVTTRNGETCVSLDNAGNATIDRNGNVTSIADGQRLSLGNGEFVSRANDGSLTVGDGNAQGGSISTTLKENGQGVDVSTQASNVDLGGYLVNGNGPAQNVPTVAPHMQRYGARRYEMNEGPEGIAAAE
jgi:hypothetical protein